MRKKCLPVVDTKYLLLMVKLPTSVKLKGNHFAGRSSRQISRTTQAYWINRNYGICLPLFYIRWPVKLYKEGTIEVMRRRRLFGFRWFEWTADRGFWMVSISISAELMCIRNQAGWGDAVTEAAMYRDVSVMKEAGFDLIRGSHYPHAPALFEEL